jgi:hypothetical protein
MAIELIIRAVAGTIVLSSLALGYYIDPLWFLLTAFIGFNLLQSSVTKFCPLEIILRKVKSQ